MPPIKAVSISYSYSRKGPAVRATRAQADRVLYKAAVREILENQANLMIFQQAVDDLIVEGDSVRGVVNPNGLKIPCAFRCPHRWDLSWRSYSYRYGNHSGGRAGDPPSIALADRLRELPLRVDRLKTGTPPRIDARSVDSPA